MTGGDLGADREIGPPPSVSVRLAHACAQTLVAEAGYRCLHAKGWALPDELRERRGGGTDVDLLVSPIDADDVAQVLAAHGWEQRTSFGKGSVFEHAATFYNPVWGTIDLHRTYPGLDTSPECAFDAMWAERETRIIGGVECPVPCDDHHRLILLLHAARAGNRSSADFALGWSELSDAHRWRIRRAANLLGAGVPLAIFVDGINPAQVKGPRVHLWAALSRRAGTTDLWTARVRDVKSLRQAAELLADALTANSDHLALSLGHEPSARELVVEQCRRAAVLGRWVLRRVSGRGR